MTENYNISLVECQAGNRGIKATIMARLSWFTPCVGSLKKREERERVRRFRIKHFFRTEMADVLMQLSFARKRQPLPADCCNQPDLLCCNNQPQLKRVENNFRYSSFLALNWTQGHLHSTASPRESSTKKNWFPPSLSSILTRYDCIRERERVCEPQHLWRL